MDTITGSLTRDNLYAGDFPTVRSSRTIASGQVLARGTVLGIVTASGHAAPCDTALDTGVENIDSILLADVDTTAGTSVAPVAITGEFQTQTAVFGGVTTVADVAAAARLLSIFFKYGAVADNV